MVWTWCGRRADLRCVSSNPKKDAVIDVEMMRFRDNSFSDFPPLAPWLLKSYLLRTSVIENSLSVIATNTNVQNHHNEHSPPCWFPTGPGPCRSFNEPQAYHRPTWGTSKVSTPASYGSSLTHCYVTRRHYRH